MSQKSSASLDLRLLPVALGLWALSAASLWGAPIWLVWLGLPVLVLAAFATQLSLHTGIRAGATQAIVVVLLVSLQLLCIGTRPELAAQSQLNQWIGSRSVVQVHATVVADPHRVQSAGNRSASETEARVQIELKAASISSPGGTSVRAPVRLRLFASEQRWHGVSFGDTVEVRGTLGSGRPGERDQATLVATGEPKIVAASGLTRFATGVRMTFRSVSASFGGKAAQLLPGMVLGDRETLSAQLSNDMKAAGLTHLLAVSGANCTYLLIFVFILFRACCLPRVVTMFATLGVLAGYVLLTRPEPSIIRAATMGALGALSLVQGRRSTALILLMGSVVLLLFADPWLSVEIGFALSVCATAGLIVLAEPLRQVLSGFLPRLFASGLCVPLAAQVACTPVLLLLQPTLNPYSVGANLVSAPLVPMITIVGLLAMCVGPFSIWAAHVVAQPASWGAEIIGREAEFFASLPGAKLPWVSGPGGVALAVLALALFCALILTFNRQRVPERLGQVRRRLSGGLWSRLSHFQNSPPIPSNFSSHYSSEKSASPVRTQRRLRSICVLLAFLLVGTLSWTLFLVHQKNSVLTGTVIVGCDVGQGDGFLIKVDPSSAIVIDTGEHPEDMRHCLSKYHVTKVPLLVLTHTHADHIGGLSAVVEQTAVGKTIYSSSLGQAQAEELLTRSAHHNGTSAAKPFEVERAYEGEEGDIANVHWRVISAGDTQAHSADPLGSDERVGPGSAQDPKDGALAPKTGQEKTGAGESQRENDASIVLELHIRLPGASATQAGEIRALFTGDLEEDRAHQLLRHYGAPWFSGIDILKIAHHGSSGAGVELIDAIHPRIALISCGKNNDYGHPHARIIQELTRIGSQVLRTDQQGDISVGLQ